MDDLKLLLSHQLLHCKQTIPFFNIFPKTVKLPTREVAEFRICLFPLPLMILAFTKFSFPNELASVNTYIHPLKGDLNAEKGETTHTITQVT